MEHPSRGGAEAWRLARRVWEEDYALTRAEALVLCDPASDLDDLMYWANALRRKWRGREVRACSIVSARTGACSEDCAFCAQSAHHRAAVSIADFLPPEKIAAAGRESRGWGSYALGIVTSGRAPDEKDLERIRRCLAALDAVPGLEKHLSIGAVDEAQLAKLKPLGLTCVHHNLETSRRFFPRICTTHSYDERLAAARAVKRQGLRLCCGGIFGLGETWEDRVDLALELRELGADSAPLNFLHPIPGTPLEKQPPLPPLEILRIIALFRLLLFRQDLSVCGGREANLRDLQALIFQAGANGLMLGNYLTTAGRSAAADLQMLADLGLRLAGRERS